MEIDAIAAEVEKLDCQLVEITGGEPLLQDGVYALIDRLLEDGHEVLIETGGHRSIERLPDAVVAILDVKCPASGEAAKMHWPNLELLRPADEVKFVIQDRADFDYACDVVAKYALDRRGRAVLFSPAFGKLAPDQLARWMLDDGVHARLQLQQHKYIWPPDARGV
jgi:7-carboxy-7-deazaguanine synthase